MNPGRRTLSAAMPAADLYRKTVSRDALVERYGDSTVVRAEIATLMNILIASRICTASEFVDVMIQQCERIETQRRQDANLDADKG